MNNKNKWFELVNMRQSEFDLLEKESQLDEFTNAEMDWMVSNIRVAENLHHLIRTYDSKLNAYKIDDDGSVAKVVRNVRKANTKMIVANKISINIDITGSVKDTDDGANMSLAIQGQFSIVKTSDDWFWVQMISMTPITFDQSADSKMIDEIDWINATHCVFKCDGFTGLKMLLNNCKVVANHGIIGAHIKKQSQDPEFANRKLIFAEITRKNQISRQSLLSRFKNLFE